MGQNSSCLPVDDHEREEFIQQGEKTKEMAGFPRKFPSPEKDEEMDDEDIEDASCEELVITGIPFVPNKVVSVVNPCQENVELQHCNFVINHEGQFKVLWDWFVLILVIFTAIQIPFYAAFSKNNDIILDMVKNEDVRPMLVLSLIVDCMFILDIFLNFRTTFIKPSSDVLEKNPKKLAVYYLRTWFIIDLLAAIPFDWIMHTSTTDGHSTPTLVGLLKSARLLRLFRVARRLDRYSEYGVAVFLLLMCLFTLIAHWLACIWNGISIHEENNSSNSWARRMELTLYPATITTKQLLNSTASTLFNKNTISPNQMTQSQRYIASLYFVLSSMTGVGFGNIAATTEIEQIFSIITMLLGALMYACIFGNMVAIVQRLYSKASTFHTQMNTIREFMKFYSIPEDLQQSIKSYVRREWAVTQGIDAETVLSRFPECIQADLTYELYKKTFRNVIPLNEATISCMRALAMKFKTMTLQAGNYVVRQGEEVNRLYIVGKGSLEVLVEGNLELYLTCNSTFGYDFEMQYHKPKAKANIRAASLVEINYIHMNDFLEIMECYPKFFERFKTEYKHSYDLNDPDEEGYVEQDIKQKEEKLHIAAIARQALGMPILHKWNRVHRHNKAQQQQQQQKQQNNNMQSTLNHNGRTEHDEKKFNVNGSSTVLIPNGGSTFNRQPPRPRPTSVPTPKQMYINGYVSSDTPLLVSTESTDVVEEITTTTGFDQRITALETKITDLSVSIDQTLSKVLFILQDLKKNNKVDRKSCCGDEEGRQHKTPKETA